jgi:DNA-binding response OmpR family regulator
MDAVHREIMEEKAGALARTERRLLDALAAYRGQSGMADRASDVVWDVVEAVTSLVVQREACGLRDAKQVFDFYEVPREVVARIGIRRSC